MKHRYLHLVAAVMLLALAGYAIAAITEKKDEPPTTVACWACVCEWAEAEGVILRDETYVCCPFAPAFFAVAEGERVQGGSIVCVSKEALEDYLSYLDRHDGKPPENMRGCAAAPCAGFFSSDLDGMECVTPEMPDDALLPVPEDAVGKIIAGGWYFVADIEGSHELREGQELTLSLREGDFPAEVISYDGKRVALRVHEGLEAVLDMRYTEATLRITDLSGIDIPRGALHTDQDGDFVYTLRAGRPTRTPVRIIYRSETLCLAAEDELREGMEFVLSSR